jgi:glycosyltransferase involved in cell wall biosynthesis
VVAAVDVSVIVPVFNAAGYVREAVRSALQQPETTEVVLAEDRSTDHSLAVCREMATADGRVRVLGHPGGRHRGPGASRNLGIRGSSCAYVAFLDADDFYLPGRFAAARELLEREPALDGVYEAVANRAENEAAMQRWRTAGRSTSALTTVTVRSTPEQLFVLMATKGVGYFYLNGLTVRRTVFEKTGFFDEHLQLHQDTALAWKMAAVARLAPGRLAEPVAVRRIHERNRISAPRSSAEIHRAKLKLWITLWRWISGVPDREKQRIVAERLLNSTMRTSPSAGGYLRRADASYSSSFWPFWG